MYKCRRCKKDLEYNDRYCFSCGAYIGEPVIWHNPYESKAFVNSTEEFEKGLEAGSKTSNMNLIVRMLYKLYTDARRILDQMFVILKFPEIGTEHVVKTINFKETVILTSLIISILSIVVCLLAKFSFEAPNDLLGFVFPFNLFDIDLKSALNLPSSMAKIFIYSCLGSAQALSLLFCIIYSSIRFFCRVSINGLELWNSLVISSVFYIFSLISFLCIGLLNKSIAVILLYLGILVWTIELHNSIEKLVKFRSHRLVYIISASSIMVYVLMYSYLYEFTR